MINFRWKSKAMRINGQRAHLVVRNDEDYNLSNLQVELSVVGGSRNSSI